MLTCQCCNAATKLLYCHFLWLQICTDWKSWRKHRGWYQWGGAGSFKKPITNKSKQTCAYRPIGSGFWNFPLLLLLLQLLVSSCSCFCPYCCNVCNACCPCCSVLRYHIKSMLDQLLWRAHFVCHLLNPLTGPDVEPYGCDTLVKYGTIDSIHNQPTNQPTDNRHQAQTTNTTQQTTRKQTNKQTNKQKKTKKQTKQSNKKTNKQTNKQKNNGPVVCNDAETQVTQEGSDENSGNYSTKSAFLMLS